MAVRYPLDLVASPVKAIISIPTLSFLVIPAFSSYSTSINLLFFYMTWAILLKTNDPIQIELYGTLGVRILFYVLPSLAFLAFDSAMPDLAVKIKEHGKSALPMGEEPGGRKGQWWKVALISITNVVLSVAVQIGLEILFTQVFHLRSLLKVSTTVPFPWSIAKDLVIGLCLREILTYTLHRYVLHSEGSALTELHDSWQHSMQTPFSLVAHYDHPSSYILHVFLPMYLPAIIFRFHLITYHIYLILVSLEECFAYSGYNILPSAFILGGIARRQEKHLMNDGEGNFGCFGLADALMGTSLGADLVEDVIDEADQKPVGKQTLGKAKATGKEVGKGGRKGRKGADRGEDEDEHEDDRSSKGRPRRTGKSEDNQDSEATPESPIRKSGRPRKASKKSSDESEPNQNSKGRRGKPATKTNSRSRKPDGDI